MLTGKWAFGTKSANADKVLNIMGMFNLHAVSTSFQPKKKSSTVTYVFCEEGSFMPKTSKFEGSWVSAFYKGKRIYGMVGEEVQQGREKMWNVKFEDNYSTIADERRIRKWLVPAKRSFKQIDHIIISQRWKSCVTNCSTDWSPSIHRSRWGIREDHALVKCTWKWRLRQINDPTGVDYSALAIPGAQYASRFNDEFEKHFAEPFSPSEQYMHWQKATLAAAKAVLPPRTGGNLTARDVSDRTRQLIAKREGMDPKRNTRAEYDSNQQAIKESSLRDWKDWVNGRVTAMETANTHNDTRKVFAIVDQLSRKPKPPPAKPDHRCVWQND